MQEELERLQRNMERREARERAKGIIGSPSVANSPGGTENENGDASAANPGSGKKGRTKKNNEGTGRRCANCGQVGHIKTNKKCADSSFSFASSTPLPDVLDTFLCELCALVEKSGKEPTGFSTSGMVGTGRKGPKTNEAYRAKRREQDRARRAAKKAAREAAEAVANPALGLANSWLDVPRSL